MSAVVVVVPPVARCAQACDPATRHEVAWLLLTGIGVGVAGLGGLLVMSVVDAVRRDRRRR